MAVLDFDDFCTSLCELIGVPPPPLAPNAHGVVGFTVTCRLAQIGLVSDTRGHEPAVLMVAALGAAPAQDELLVLRALLQANYTALGLAAPSFMRDMAGGLWQCHVFALAHLQVQTVLQALEAAAATVEAWQSHHFLEPSTAQASALPQPLTFFNLVDLA